MQRPFWEIVLIRGGAFSHTLQFENDDGDRVSVLTKNPRILVKHSKTQVIEWTLAGGYFTILAEPAGLGQIRFDLTAGQINALPFSAAEMYFFLNGENEYLFPGSIRVK